MKRLYGLIITSLVFLPAHAGTIVAFQNNIEVGGHISYQPQLISNPVLGGADMDASFGVRITKIAFVGIGVGIHSNFSKIKSSTDTTKMSEILMPLYFDGRVYIPTKADINPYFRVCTGLHLPIYSRTDNYSLELGYQTYINKENVNRRIGAFVQCGLGCEIRRFQFNLGYRYMGGAKTNPSYGHYGFLTLGVRLGKSI